MPLILFADRGHRGTNTLKGATMHRSTNTPKGGYMHRSTPPPPSTGSPPDATGKRPNFCQETDHPHGMERKQTLQNSMP